MLLCDYNVKITHHCRCKWVLRSIRLIWIASHSRVTTISGYRLPLTVGSSFRDIVWVVPFSLHLTKGNTTESEVQEQNGDKDEWSHQSIIATTYRKMKFQQVEGPSVWPTIKSNHFIGLRSSKDYNKRPGGVVGVYGKGQLHVSFFTWVDVCRGNGFREEGG